MRAFDQRAACTCRSVTRSGSPRRRPRQGGHPHLTRASAEGTDGVERTNRRQPVAYGSKDCRAWGQAESWPELIATVAPGIPVRFTHDYRWIRGEVPRLSCSTSSNVAIEVSPGVVIARAPCATP